MALSCTKEEQFTTLTFGMVEEHTMTRTYVDDVRTAIGQRIPQTVNLTLTRDKTGKTYKVATGESITIPVGEYTVKGTAAGSSLTAFPRQGMWDSDVASIVVNEKVSVVEGTTSYTLSPTFDCFAIVALEDVASYTYQHANTSNKADEDGIKVRFFKWDNNYELIVTAKPADYDSKDDARFVFGAGGVTPKNGSFYVLHPESVTTEEGGFTFSFGDWTEGTL